MVYEKIHFYPSAVEGRTEAEFIAAQPKHIGLTEAQLKEVYALMAPKPVEIKQETKPAVKPAAKQ